MSIKSMKKDFIVIASLDAESVQFEQVQAENHDVACHSVEITEGHGTYIALNKNQAQNMVEKLQSFLNI